MLWETQMNSLIQAADMDIQCRLNSVELLIVWIAGNQYECNGIITPRSS